MTEELVEAVKIAVRYDMADSNGETRRQRNARFNWPSPVAVVSEEGQYLLGIYWRLNRLKGGGFSGPNPLLPGVVRDWMENFSMPLSLDEREVISKLDDTFNRTFNEESTKDRAKDEDSKRDREYNELSNTRRRLR